MALNPSTVTAVMTSTTPRVLGAAIHISLSTRILLNLIRHGAPPEDFLAVALEHVTALQCILPALVQDIL